MPYEHKTSQGVQIIAEGVETEGQLEFLKERGCTEVQGHYISRPLPADRFEVFMREKSVTSEPSRRPISDLLRCPGQRFGSSLCDTS